MTPPRQQQHKCNKEDDITRLSNRVDGVYKTIHGNGDGDGMKVQLATVATNLDNLITTIGPMSEDIKEAKNFILGYKEREDAIRNEEAKKRKIVSSWLSIAAIIISLATLVVMAIDLKKA